jgi:ADP-ribosyl-[dinitrogen reductase] hydrolase
MSSPSLGERALGAYLGFACGDAFGAPVEFLTPGEIQATHRLLTTMVGGGWLHLAPGQVTDDTQMALALGRAILAGPDWEVRRVCEQFALWLRGKPLDVGHTCRRGIRRFIVEGTLAGPPNEGDAGNGAAMRNLPVVLASLSDPAAFRHWTLEQCHVTHNHPLSDAATLTLGRMTRRLLTGEGKDGAWMEAQALVAAHPDFRFSPYRGISSAYVVDTVQTVFHYFFASHTFGDCLIGTANQGGDADTTSAIAGMLAGAHYGIANIPNRWLSRLEAGAVREIRDQTPRLLEWK